MCKCIKVEVGSYANQVELPAPAHLIEWARKADFSLGGERNTVCIDRCLVKEIRALWSEGITTTGCCCGHNKVSAYIGVIDSDIPKMKAMGYRVHFNSCRPSDEDEFIPMTVTDEYFGPHQPKLEPDFVKN